MVSQIWRLMVTIFLTYLTTLLLFPGVISEVQYEPIGDWMPIILIALFNLSDLISKWLALVPIKCTSTRLLLLGLPRLVLIPLIILCVSPSPCHPVLSTGVVALSVVFVVALGLSNGYFGSLPMINVSLEVKDEKHREVAGQCGLFISPGFLSTILRYSLSIHVITCSLLCVQWSVVMVALFAECTCVHTSYVYHHCSSHCIAPGALMIWTLLLGLSVGSVLAYAITPLTQIDHCIPNRTDAIFQLCYHGYNDTLT